MSDKPNSLVPSFDVSYAKVFTAGAFGLLALAGLVVAGALAIFGAL